MDYKGLLWIAGGVAGIYAYHKLQQPLINRIVETEISSTERLKNLPPSSMEYNVESLKLIAKYGLFTLGMFGESVLGVASGLSILN